MDKKLSTNWPLYSPSVPKLAPKIISITTALFSSFSHNEHPEYLVPCQLQCSFWPARAIFDGWGVVLTRLAATLLNRWMAFDDLSTLHRFIVSQMLLSGLRVYECTTTHQNNCDAFCFKFSHTSIKKRITKCILFSRLTLTCHTYAPFYILHCFWRLHFCPWSRLSHLLFVYTNRALISEDKQRAGNSTTNWLQRDCHWVEEHCSDVISLELEKEHGRGTNRGREKRERESRMKWERADEKEEKEFS